MGKHISEALVGSCVVHTAAQTTLGAKALADFAPATQCGAALPATIGTTLKGVSLLPPPPPDRNNQTIAARFLRHRTAPLNNQR